MEKGRGKGKGKSSPNPLNSTSQNQPKRQARGSHFSPLGLSSVEELQKTGSIGPLSPGASPSTSFSAGGSGNPSGHDLLGGGPELVSAAPPGGRRPGDEPACPSVASDPGGLGDGHHDLFRGTLPVGPGVSNEATVAPPVEALEGSSSPHCSGASSGPAGDPAATNLGQMADLLGISEAEAARDPFCRVVASCPGKPLSEAGQEATPKPSSKASVAADDGLLHPHSGEALLSPALTDEDSVMTEDSFRTVVSEIGRAHV